MWEQLRTYKARGQLLAVHTAVLLPPRLLRCLALCPLLDFSLVQPRDALPEL